YSIPFFDDLLWLRKKSLAPAFFSSAVSKSLGISKASTSSSAFHEPFCLAISTTTKPASAINPSAINRSTLSLLIFDQVLLAFRLVKNWWVQPFSTAIFLLSIQPKQRATSTASLQLMDGLPEALLNWTSHTDVLRWWFRSIHSRHSSTVWG